MGVLPQRSAAESVVSRHQRMLMLPFVHSQKQPLSQEKQHIGGAYNAMHDWSLSFGTGSGVAVEAAKGTLEVEPFELRQ